jgi:transglutaminase-like putative cysteine protease
MKYGVLSILISASMLLANLPVLAQFGASPSRWTPPISSKLVSQTNRTLSSQVSPEDKNLRRLRSAMNIENPIVRNYAVKLAAKFPGRLNYGQILNIYDYLLKNWKYVSDPKGMEYFASASETIDDNLAGDCDDFAVLIASLLEGIGGTTRITFAFGPGGGHAFTEIYLGTNSDSLQDKAANAIVNHYKHRKHLQGKKIRIGFRVTSKNELWLNLDWFAEYGGGPYFKFTKQTIYYPRKGRYDKF